MPRFTSRARKAATRAKSAEQNRAFMADDPGFHDTDERLSRLLDEVKRREGAE